MRCKNSIVRDTTIKQGKGLTKREKQKGKVISKQVNYTAKEYKELKRQEANERNAKD